MGKPCEQLSIQISIFAMAGEKIKGSNNAFFLTTQLAERFGTLKRPIGRLGY